MPSIQLTSKEVKVVSEILEIVRNVSDKDLQVEAIAGLKKIFRVKQKVTIFSQVVDKIKEVDKTEESSKNTGSLFTEMYKK